MFPSNFTMICVHWLIYNVWLGSVKLVGLLGLLLIVLEGGLHIELLTVTAIGHKAASIALTGTTLPVLLSLAIMPRFHAFSNIEGLIAGVSLSSTAIGMAAKLMQSLDLLSSHIGRLITCAAMIDDVASLVLLAVISNTGEKLCWKVSVLHAYCLTHLWNLEFGIGSEWRRGHWCRGVGHCSSRHILSTLHCSQHILLLPHASSD